MTDRANLPSDFVRAELTPHQIERKERAAQRASRLSAAANAQYRAARSHVDGIPMGQPILVGHHSERRHRRDLERHDAKMRKSLELQRAADRSDPALAGRSISSDDPDAIDALRAELAAAETNHEVMKRANAAWRKGFKRGDKDGACEAMREAGLSERLIKQAVRAIEVMPSWTVPFQVGNGNAGIRRIRARIEELEHRAAEPEREPIVGEGFRIEESKEDNRIRFHFDERPDRAVVQKMKSAGFRWSPRAGAWQRQLNANGRRAALEMARELFGWSEGAA